jgi:hypothetical protein
MFVAEQKNVQTQSYLEANYDFEFIRGVNAGDGIGS